MVSMIGSRYSGVPLMVAIATILLGGLAQAGW
jgi:hypothetical protein